MTLDDPSVRAQFEAGQDENLPRMSFGDHLDELRKRLIRAVLAILVALIVITPFKDEVMGVIIEPYRILWRSAFRDYLVNLEQRDKDGELTIDELRKQLQFCHDHGAAILDGTFPKADMHQLPNWTGFNVPYTLMALGGLEDIWTFMTASFLFSLALAAPIVIWQLWAFIAAGLYKRERKIFYRYFPFMMSLLISGVLFGYFMAVPYGLGFLIKMMKSDQVQAMLSVGQYYSLLFSMTTALGLVFQLPLVMVAIQKVGLIRHKTMRKSWRIVVLTVFIISAILTPPDPFSMFLMAIPTLGLYILGLVLTYHGQKYEAPLLPTTDGSAPT